MQYSQGLEHLKIACAPEDVPEAKPLGLSFRKETATSDMLVLLPEARIALLYPNPIDILKVEV